MNKLTIFWNDKLSDSFSWHAQQSLSDAQSNGAIHDLDSHDLLKADLACLADNAQNKSVELVLSNSDIYFSQVTLPNKAQRHQRKAIPYLLEEQLSESIEDVFIAIGERSKQGDIPVRVINKDYLDQIIEQFSDAEIKLDSIRVDLDLLETPESGYNLVFSENQILVSEESDFQWSCDIDDFNWLVQKRLADISSETEGDELPIALPMTVVVENEDTYTLFEKQLPVGVFAPQLNLVDSTSEFLSVQRQPAFSLLQGDYEPKVENSPFKKLLMNVASLAAIILVAHITYQGSQIVMLKQQQAQLTQERDALRKQGFPGKKRVTDKTLNTYLKTASGGEGGSSFLTMLQSTSEEIKNLEALYPTNISYDSSRNELRIDVIAKDLPELNQYRDALKKSGHQVDMSSATQRGDSYSSRLIIRK